MLRLIEQQNGIMRVGMASLFDRQSSLKVIDLNSVPGFLHRDLSVDSNQCMDSVARNASLLCLLPAAHIQFCKLVP